MLRSLRRADLAHLGLSRHGEKNVVGQTSFHCNCTYSDIRFAIVFVLKSTPGFVEVTVFCYVMPCCPVESY